MKNPKSKKLWQKSASLDEKIEQFTVGQDRELDLHLAEFDVIGSLAHITMLHSIELLTKEEFVQLRKGLLQIHKEIKQNKFSIGEGIEDVHSQVELLLTERLGDLGKKIHSGRSRNDQILLDMRLFLRSFINTLVKDINALFELLIDLSELHKDVLLPGYTHMQVAMPSSFGLWFAAFAESLVDDIIQLQTAYKIVNKNPLGSAAGYGSSFPLNRTLTTELLGFDDLNYNSVYAQMGRGKTERIVSQAIASVAETIGKMADDIILYMSQNFTFISFPDSLTTGSSIMPHKKNPDVFEIMRARCNQLKALPNEIVMLTTNLNSGYHRDLQIVKERFIPALFEMKDCLNILHYSLEQIEVNADILKDKRYENLFSVEAVNQLVLNGMPFRDAYLQVAQDAKDGQFKKPEKVDYVHEGSIGNLCNDKIKSGMQKVMLGFDFKKSDFAVKSILDD